MKKYLLIFAVVLFLLSNSLLYAETASTTGFLPKQVWYSKEPLIEGETVNIYAAVWNGEKNSITTHVEFYDGKTILGARDVTVPSLNLQEVFIAWKVTSGDHIISAKISSTSTLINNKKEQINLENNITEQDHISVSVVLRNKDGTEIKSVDNIKNEVTKVTTAIKDSIPDSVGVPITSSFNSVDTFRNTTYTKIIDTKTQTQKEVDAFKITSDSTKSDSVTTKGVQQPTKEDTKSKPLDATDKPITYIKLFLFSLLGFIFGSKIVFYGLCALIVLLIIRFIYRKIRHR